MPGVQFPFTYSVMTDPVSGATDGLLKQCTASNTCPKIMQIDGAFEWWGGGAVARRHGRARQRHSVAVQRALLPGTGHAAWRRHRRHNWQHHVPAAGSLCQLPELPVSETPVERALIPALVNGSARTRSRRRRSIPTVASGTLVAPTRTVGFPNLANVTVPSGAAATPTAFALNYTGEYNQLFVTDYTQCRAGRETCEAIHGAGAESRCQRQRDPGVRMPER